jgi:DNA replication protein DnaC
MENYDLRKVGFRERHMEQTFENYTAVTDRQKTVVQLLKDHAECFSNRWVVMIGPPGTGKDHLLSALVKSWVSMNLNNPKIYADTQQGILRKYRVLAYNTEGNTELDAMRYFCDLDILVMRDVGVKDLTDNERATMVDMIDRRYDDRKLVFVSGNLAPGEFKIAFDERVASRLVEMALRYENNPYISCKWSDYRRTERKEDK